MKPIYLDHNATTPIAAEVAEAMIPYLKEHFGNPSCTHWYGTVAKKAVEEARRQVAGLLGCEVDEIIFTSGGTESNNFAIRGIAETYHDKGNHIITSQIEHPAILNVCSYLEQRGFTITYVPVDEYGMISPEEIEKNIRNSTLLITIMHANNEVGTIQPVEEISHIAKKYNIIFHTDAAQSAGKIPTKVKHLGCDMLSIAGHKIYAPKGVGALFIRRGMRLKPFIIGAGQEQGQRAGTENVLEIVGLGKACEIAEKRLQKNSAYFQQLRDQLWQGLKGELPDIKLNGHPDKRLPNTLNISFPGIDANTLLSELEEIAASPGAACHAEVAEPSHVLTAMKVPLDLALSTIRFSVGALNDSEQIKRATEIIAKAVKRLKPGAEEIHEQAAIDTIKLTHFTHGLGCACKLRPQNLEKVLQNIPLPLDPNVLVSAQTADDAAVYKLREDLAVVQTVDFFTPVVDDAYTFGAIAAANSLSDIYAMGGKPLFALSIVGFPEKRLPLAVLQDIMKGAVDKAAEAGISIVGGHTVEDSEPKFGLVVTGTINPKKVFTNSNAQIGDMLILTKPLGLGIITTGLKRGIADKQIAERAIKVMTELNAAAAEAMIEAGAHACTDITGFGLLGHLKEMMYNSKLDAEIYYEKVPIIEGAKELTMANAIPGGTLANMEYVKPYMHWDDSVPHTYRILLCDAQTSGGLLIAITEKKADTLLKLLDKKGVKGSAIIGKITKEGSGYITVL
jgi:cysteine desulfurase